MRYRKATFVRRLSSRHCRAHIEDRRWLYVTAGPGPDTEAAEAFHPQTDSGAGELLNALASETWPLLEDSSPITKADQAQLLGDPAEN